MNVSNENERIAETLKLAAGATRVAIMRAIEAEEMSVSVLAERLGVVQSALSAHLTLLRMGGIVERRREGSLSLYSLTSTGRKLAELTGRI